MPVPLDAISREVVADLLPEAVAKGIDLGFEAVEEVEVLCEPAALASAVRNMVGNAVKFTPEGGQVDLGVHRAGDAAVLQVEDSGPGIPPRDLDRIFEPFVRGEHSPGAAEFAGPLRIAANFAQILCSIGFRIP